MYCSHPDIRTPSDDTVIWRYMSVDKYLSFLKLSALHMCRLDKFEDPWEGNWPAGYRELVSGETIDQANSFLFVNCWHANVYESAAMWDLYGARHSGVAVKTTVGDLKQAIVDDEDVFIGAVQYVDFEKHLEKSLINDLVPAFLKRLSFVHENEVRLLSCSIPSNYEQHGATTRLVQDRIALSCKMDLSTILKEVYFSPTMPGWLAEALTDVSQKYGISDSFHQSKLYDRLVR